MRFDQRRFGLGSLLLPKRRDKTRFLQEGRFHRPPGHRITLLDLVTCLGTCSRDEMAWQDHDYVSNDVDKEASLHGVCA